MAEKRRARELQEKEIINLTSEIQQLAQKMSERKQEENARSSAISQMRMEISTIECVF